MNWTLVSTLTLTIGEAELPEFLAELERARWTAKLRIAAATSPAAERRFRALFASWRRKEVVSRVGLEPTT